MPEYIVLSTLAVDRGLLAPYRSEHMKYMADLKAAGKIRMAGRFTDGGGGFYILVCGTLEEAKGLADADPYHAHGLRGYVLREWQQTF